jgi:hypothetical protein
VQRRPLAAQQRSAHSRLWVAAVVRQVFPEGRPAAQQGAQQMARVHAVGSVRHPVGRLEHILQQTRKAAAVVALGRVGFPRIVRTAEGYPVTVAMVCTQTFQA